ncbi:hypothetical protein KOR34_31860 [Posidoniimonas corsicana]|uniref:Uncharacterized protein n=1 Tax=Posidoniimonas corsicana TaxID=1938618 RepID=A0A5C5VJT6_9BACT|nr:hypothetical protein [Posidoniimonas corsicana]TWT38217.1 hypothetical protein KOR34_31860 [Posidoniimonas corsicana]
MSFVHHYCYTIAAKPILLNCTEVDRGFAELLVSDPYVYRNREFIGKSLITDGDHEQFIKLLFLADMRTEYESHFFGGTAPIAVEFFDKWWTLTKSDEPQDVKSVVMRLRTVDFEEVVGSFSDAMSEHLHRLRSDDARPS